MGTIRRIRALFHPQPTTPDICCKQETSLGLYLTPIRSRLSAKSTRGRGEKGRGPQRTFLVRWGLKGIGAGRVPSFPGDKPSPSPVYTAPMKSLNLLLAVALSLPVLGLQT